MATGDASPRAHVRIVFWEPYLGTRPLVLASRDLDGANRRLASSIWEHLAQYPRGETDTWFLKRKLSPSQWSDGDDVDRWLNDVALQLDGPVWVAGDTPLAGDATPWVEHDLAVGVYSQSEDLANDTGFFAGFDQLQVERALAMRLLQYDTAVVLPQVDINDPHSVTQWLDAARDNLPGVGFSVHTINLPPATQADTPALTETSAVAETPPISQAVSESRDVWVAGIYWVGTDPEETPEFITAWTRQHMEREVAQEIHREFLDNADADPRTREFLDNHDSPADWDDPGEVSAWLDDLYTSSPGTGFTYQKFTITPQPGGTRLQVAGLLEFNPFDAVLLADTDQAVLNEKVVDWLLNEFDQGPPERYPSVFINQHGLPGDDPDRVASWLEAFQQEYNYPSVGMRTISLPPAPPPVQQPPVKPAAMVATPADTVATPAAPPSQTVRVGDLWAGMISFEAAQPQVWVGTSYDQVAQAMVRILADTIEPDVLTDAIEQRRNLFLQANLVDMDNPESVDAWLTGFRDRFDDPDVFITNTYDVTQENNLPPAPEGATWASRTAPQPVRVQPPQPVVASVLTPDDAAASPLNREVVVGVLRWDDADRIDATEALTADTVEQLRAEAARRVYQEMRTPASDADDLLAQIGDPDLLHGEEVRVWLDQAQDFLGFPALDVYEHVPAGLLDVRVADATTRAILNLVDPQPAPPVVGSGQVVIDTDRPRLWEAINEGGIPDLLASNLADEPNPHDYPDSALGGQDYDAAIEDWMEQTLQAAQDVATLPKLRDRLDRLEYLRDRLARELAQHSLPVEPQQADYLVKEHPRYDGEFYDMAHRWDYNTWLPAFTQAALVREQLLAQLVATTSDGVQPPADEEESQPAAAAPRRDETRRPDVTVTVGFSVNPTALSGGFAFTNPSGDTAGHGMGL